MNIFLDANILVAVLNKEYPVFTYAARILSLADSPRYNIYTSPLCLAIAFYFSSKKSGNKIAKEKIASLAAHINITDTNAESVLKALANKKVSDFEDGLEYYSALAARCELIISEDMADFHFSEINVLSAAAFFDQHPKRRKK
ncbi:MAG: PIN domain-containing protein [Chitinophagaceae bacterium]|nr:PIN domain-containing protein [Chitinophagaceae bacterium]